MNNELLWQGNIFRLTPIKFLFCSRHYKSFAFENLKCNITPSLRAFPYFSNIVLSLFSYTSLEEGKSALA